jgi:hypothetical protein
MAGITAASLEGQTESGWEWIVALDPRDPYFSAREKIVRNLGGRIVQASLDGSRQRVAARAYRSTDWSSAIEADGWVATTRLDDDDALARDFCERLYPALDRSGAYIFPEGYRINRGSVVRVRHDRNAYSTLLDAAGTKVIYDYSHTRIGAHVPVYLVDDEPAWLWVRHKDSISLKHMTTSSLLTDDIRQIFPVDWRRVEGSSCKACRKSGPVSTDGFCGDCQPRPGMCEGCP